MALPAPAFPLHIFPRSVHCFLTEAATCTAVPVEMVAGPFLAYTGGLIGNRLSLWMNPTWSARASLWLAVVAPPGSAKTPALRVASRPLDRLQRAAAARHREERAHYAEALSEWKKTKAGVQPEEPTLRDYFTTDITREGLAPLLEQFPGIVVDQDELSGWVGGLDRYAGGKGSDKQFYLSLWSGTPVKVNRKGSRTIYCPSPVASVVGGIQPDLVKTLQPTNGDRDGFVERILPLVPECAPAPWNRGGGLLGDQTVQPVLDLYHRLDLLLPVDLASNEWGTEITLGPEAETKWEAWFNENNTGLIPNTPPLLAGFYSKLQTYAPRFALILHALHHPPNNEHQALSRSFPKVVSAEHMQGAIELGEFFRAHIHRFLVLLGADAQAGSPKHWSRIEQILERKDLQDDEGWVMHSKLLRALSERFNAGSLSKSLEEMLKASRVESRVRPSRTKSGMEWRLART